MSSAPFPEYHVLNYFRDNDDHCALTLFVHGVRFHIDVDLAQLKDRSENGKRISQEYKDLLSRVKKSEEAVDEDGNSVDDGSEQSDGEHDSGIDVPSSDDGEPKPAGENNKPVDALHSWILVPMTDHLQSKAPESGKPQKRNVQDWYHSQTHFYHLEMSNGELVAKEDKSSPSREKRMQALVPDLSLPKYIRKFDIPILEARSLTVVSESDETAPLHPTLVKTEDGATLFLKLVDNVQLQPMKREIRILKEIEAKGLDKEFRVPLIRGLVVFEGRRPNIAGFLMDVIEDPKPLTHMFDPEISQSQREEWATETRRVLDLLHQNNIIWGDAKADNFMVDKNNDLWIIDFGGSFTPGWVDPELNETEAGDEQGEAKIENALRDPVANTLDPEDATQEQSEATDAPPCGVKRKVASSRSGQSDDEREHSHDSKRLRSSAENSEESDGEHGNERRYCYCNGTDSGKMIACDGENCEKGWFHFACIGIEEAPSSKHWYCDACKER